MTLKFPKKHEINTALSTFSKKEWVVFSILLVILLISTLSILESINKSFMVSVPAHGGTITEGLVGAPRFVNPILATGGADQDLVALTYSGLMRKNVDGTLIPDLAEKYDVSENGLSYTFTLKDNLFFHDGTPLTADDVIFTINKVKDPVIKSSRKINWDGISVEKIDNKTIKFNLKQSYASFLENTTLGILPASLWENSPIELNDINTNPIGSGPFMIKKVNKESSGIIDSYELTSFKKFALGEPYIKNLTLYFYQNEDDLVNALIDKKIDQISAVTPLNAENLKERNFKVETSVLPRVFGLFFNQNQNQIFTNKNVVKAIDQAIDKDKIVREVLFSYGVAIDEPLPPNLIVYQKLSEKTNSTQEDNKEKAKALLAKDGWKIGESGFLEKNTTVKKKTTKNELAFSISTGSNAPELAKAAELIKEELADIGIKVDVKTFEAGNLNQVIRTRKYDALLFGEIINHESDLFAFWHSSQRKDPGLNVAMYTNSKVDKILEDAFTTADETARIKKYAQFEDEIRKDMPAVFLYSPSFIYIVSEKLKGFSMDHIIGPADRFLNVYLWNINTENVWKVFTPN